MIFYCFKIVYYKFCAKIQNTKLDNFIELVYQFEFHGVSFGYKANSAVINAKLGNEVS